VKTWFNIQASQKTTLGLHSIKDTNGITITEFDGKPILQMDTITNAEAEVTGTFQSEL